MKKKRVIYISLITLLLLSIFLIIRKNNSNAGKIQNITTTQLKNVLKNNKDVYVIYKADYCLYCRKVYPKYKKIVKDNKINNVYCIDLTNGTTKTVSAIKKIGVEEIPVIQHYRNRKLISKLIGDSENNKIERYFEVN